jgi:hypothetical protein
LLNVAKSGQFDSAFDVSNVNFSFFSNTFGPGPLITDSPIYFFEPTTSNLNYAKSPIKLPGTDLLKMNGVIEGSYKPDNVSASVTYKSDYATIGETSGGIPTLQSISSVPVLIKPDDVGFRYYHSKNVDSYLPID